MRTLLFTLMLLAASLAMATTVYKWVDEDGITHYSDQPHANAQKVQLKNAQTYAPGANPGAAAAELPPLPVAAPTLYKGCAITAPPNGTDYANVDSLTVMVQTQPALHAGDQIYVLLDGQELNGGAATGAQFTLSPVDRGEHTLQAVVKGSDGKVACQSASVTYNVHQPSIQSPVNPVHPH
jgi:Domain of unknown function (DUF4124)